MFHVDLHTHTRFFHSWPGGPTAFDSLGATALAFLARRRGLDGVALTNHDYYEPFEAEGLTFLPGNEITTTEGHLLVIGPDPPERTAPEALTPSEAVELAHERDCAAVLPHPYRNSQIRNSDVGVDAVELNGKHTRTHPEARELAAEKGLPLVGGSDAHYPVEAGRSYTEIDAPELTPEAVVDAICDGRVEPAALTHPTDNLVQRAYRLVHRGRGHR